MRKFRLAVQLDFEVEIEGDADATPERVRQVVWRRLSAGRPEQWQVPGVRSRWFTQSFSPSTDGLCEVVEVTPEMESDPGMRPRWRLVSVTDPPAA